MSNMNFITSEIRLASKHVSSESWQALIQAVSKYVGNFRNWQIIVIPELNDIKYYIKTNCELPTTINDIDQLLIRKVDTKLDFNYHRSGLPYLADTASNLIDIIKKEKFKNRHSVKRLEIAVRPLGPEKILTSSHVFIERHGKTTKHRLLPTTPPQLLSIDFSKNHNYFYQKTPQTLNIQKILHLLSSDSQNSIVKIDTFPYLQDNYYLAQNSFSFDKHSLIVGSSGSGKSKLISLLANNLATNLNYKLKYKVVIIDPHAALEKDIGGLTDTTTIDFKTNKDSIDLFASPTANHIVNSELTLALFKSLMTNQYNPKLERVLRHSIHLLLAGNCFTFANLRTTITDSEYRNQLVKQLSKQLPDSTVSFFLTGFNEMKTEYYNEAISPIISFLDEMQIIPVLDGQKNHQTLHEVIQDNFLTIFSLDRTTMGDKPLKIISGLVMQQIMQLIQSRQIDQHIILAIDEVSILENPVLATFLSEARKYNLSVILAQQYFDQISDQLKNAIFANTSNYYIFRVSQKDALTLSDNISIKLTQSDNPAEKIKMLTGLKDRELIARISQGGELLPAFKARTVNFIPTPRKITQQTPIAQALNTALLRSQTKFSITSTVKMTELLLNQSSSRINVKGTKHD